MPLGSFAAARPGGSTILWGSGSLGMERKPETFLGRAQMGLACPRLSLWPRVAGRSAGRAPALTSSVTLSYSVVSGSSHSCHRCFIVLLSAVPALQPHVRHPVLASRRLDNHYRLTCTHNSTGVLGCREVLLQWQGDQDRWRWCRQRACAHRRQKSEGSIVGESPSPDSAPRPASVCPCLSLVPCCTRELMDGQAVCTCSVMVRS